MLTRQVGFTTNQSHSWLLILQTNAYRLLRHSKLRTTHFLSNAFKYMVEGLSYVRSRISTPMATIGGPRPRASRAVALVVVHRAHDLHKGAIAVQHNRRSAGRSSLPGRKMHALTDCGYTCVHVCTHLNYRIDRCICFNPYSTPQYWLLSGLASIQICRT